MRSILGKVRSTVLEGSFGNEKNHYQMNKIKARTQRNEKAWILFSLLTCNAMQMAKKMQAAAKQKIKQAA
jgi:transposase, IS5 family